MENKAIEQTLVLFKPDALKNNLSGFILNQLSEYNTGLRVSGTKVVSVSNTLAQEHYAEHVGKSFFPSLLEYVSGKLHFPGEADKQRIEAFVFQGPNAILKIRELCGPTNPNAARDTKPGCIRSLGAIIPIKDANGTVVGDRMDNLIHASANAADADREVKLWFKPSDIPAALRLFPVETATELYYYNNGKLASTYTAGSTCIVAPGDLIWKSDLEALKAIAKGEKAAITLETVAAKYMLNIA